MKVFDASYDAWGRQTVTLNTIGLHRGYTGHEMLNEFDIIKRLPMKGSLLLFCFIWLPEFYIGLLYNR